MVKLSWREKYVGVLVILISIIYALMQLASSFGESAHAYTIQNGAFQINKNEFYSDLRTWSVVLAGIIAGWCLLTGKRLGWMLGLPILMFLTTVIGAMVIEQVLKVKRFDRSMTGFGVAIFLLLLAILFLLLPSARQKYRVNKVIALLTLVLFIGLGGAYFFLQ